MQVQVWSDVVCPWCYIGKRRLEQALERFAHRDEVELRWRSFELDPTAPADRADDLAEHLSGKYGVPVEQARAMQDRVAATAAQEGLDLRFDLARTARTFDAHRVLHLAAERGLQGAAKERLMRAYFTEGERVGETEVLVRLAAEAGLDADEVRTVLAGDAYAADVRQDQAQARAHGITGVPFFVLDGAYGVSGAQPVEVLLQALETAWAAAHPLTPVGAAGGDQACADGSCAV